MNAPTTFQVGQQLFLHITPYWLIWNGSKMSFSQSKHFMGCISTIVDKQGHRASYFWPACKFVFARDVIFWRWIFTWKFHSVIGFILHVMVIFIKMIMVHVVSKSWLKHIYISLYNALFYTYLCTCVWLWYGVRESTGGSLFLGL